MLILVGLGVGGYFYLNHNNDSKATKTVQSVDKIKGYNYTLRSNATKYYKSLFKELKEVLESDDIDEDKYADLITKLFVSDFFNLDNKISKNDVEGKQFVYKDFRDDFVKLAERSIYKSVESDVYGDRKQELPIVNNVSTEKKDNESFKYGDSTDENAYKIDFDIEYEQDLGYQTSGTLTLIHNGKKIEVAVME